MDITTIISPLNVLIGGIIGVWLSNRLKKNADIQTFRYTKLYELNVELNTLSPSFNIKDDIGCICRGLQAHYQSMKAIYDRAEVLLDSSPELSQAFKETEETNGKITHYLIENKADELFPKDYAIELHSAVTCVEEQMKAVFLLNLRSLLR